MALLNSINSLFETAEQRAEREKYEAERKAFFESIPKRAEKTLIVGQSSESLVEELRKQLSELGVLRTLDQQRIAALEAELAQARADIIAAAGELFVPIPEPGTDMSKVMLANSQMRRERDEARADSERLDHLEQHGLDVVFGIGYGSSADAWCARTSIGFVQCANLRAAIDAARKEGK